MYEIILQERRAEIVRQNKAALTNSDLSQEDSMTASSG